MTVRRAPETDHLLTTAAAAIRPRHIVEVNATALADLLDGVASLYERGMITKQGWTYTEAVRLARDLLDLDPLEAEGSQP